MLASNAGTWVRTVLAMAAGLIALFGGVHLWWTPWRRRSSDRAGK